jgi:hypothetical protein
VAESTVNEVADVSPKVTAVAPASSVPVTTTVVPPTAAPPLGPTVFRVGTPIYVELGCGLLVAGLMNPLHPRGPDSNCGPAHSINAPSTAPGQRAPTPFSSVFGLLPGVGGVRAGAGTALSPLRQYRFRRHFGALWVGQLGSGGSVPLAAPCWCCSTSSAAAPDARHATIRSMIRSHKGSRRVAHCSVESRALAPWW